MENRAKAGGRWPWGGLFRRTAVTATPQGADEAQSGYARVVLGLLARCEDLHQQWLEQLDEQRRNERLANAAAVYHWRLNTIRDHLSQLEAPPSLARWHEALIAALDGAYRATHLLSSGYRFHNVRRICEGGLRLEEARAQGLAVREGLAGLTQPPSPLPLGREAGSD